MTQGEVGGGGGGETYYEEFFTVCKIGLKIKAKEADHYGPLRLCLPSGEWSGEPASCRLKTCRYFLLLQHMF
jgi:hypothetical protein